MKTVSFITLLLLVAASVFANPVNVSELDSDKDGRISKEEAKADPTLATMFAELDKDKDGYLTKQELAG